MSGHQNETSEDYGHGEEQTEDLLSKALNDVRELGDKLGLSQKFLGNIIRESKKGNDWSFIIKSHALMETVITHVISERLQVSGYRIDGKKEEISEFISRLPISGRTGKLTLGNKLDLIFNDTCKFFERLTEIRNFYAHDLRNIEKTLEYYIYDLKRDRQNEFFTAFIPGYSHNKELLRPISVGQFKIFLIIGMCFHLSVSYNIAKPLPTVLGKLASDI